MTDTDDTLTISRGASMCRLEGFGAAPETLRALGTYCVELVATDPDGALPLPDPATLDRLVGPDVARRIIVDAEGSTAVLQLRASGEAEAAPPTAPPDIRAVQRPRAEGEAAGAAGLLGATATGEAGGADEPSGGRLDADDEAHLHRELDRVDTDPDAPPPLGGTPEAARILAGTDSRLSQSVLRERFSAHQQLRAAVAADPVGTLAGGTPDAGAEEIPYRGDLAAARGDAPSDPLRLEPSQRVDAARPDPREAGAGTGDTSFSAFAEEVGAETLPDRLEAAAAWLADIRGRATFPRSALFETLHEADGAPPDIDEALQACARMLRARRLRACLGGELAATDKTRFRSAHR